MKRREFFGVLGGAAVTWPFAALAQQAAMPLVGYINVLPSAMSQEYLGALRQGLREIGYVEGQNVAIAPRHADGDFGRLPALFADLIDRRAAVIVATGGTPAAMAAKAATTTVPVVFATGGDPVKLGLVASVNRPGGNATGMSVLTTTLEAKRLELLREVTRADVMAVLLNPGNPDSEAQRRDIQAAARAIGQQVVIITASADADLETALVKVVEQKAGALIVVNDSFFNARRKQLVRIVARHGVPAIYAYREYVADGGLISYSTSLIEMHRQLGLYAGRILKGEKPGDLPVIQPTKFEMVINLRTAKALGLTIPPKLLFTADEVIE